MVSDIEVHQAAPAVLHHGEHVQGPEGAGHDHHEIAGNNALACRRRKVDQRRSPLDRLGGRGGMYFRTVRGDTGISSFSNSSLAIVLL